jgi:hypothetical protein
VAGAVGSWIVPGTFRQTKLKKGAKVFESKKLGNVQADANPQAGFLQHVENSLKNGGTITVRGTLSNKYFNQIYNGKAQGLENFEVTERNANVSNPGYKRADGDKIKGEIHELILKKKSK